MDKKLLLLLAIVLMALPLRAQHIEGAEVYYKLLSPKKYLVTAQVYRQCSGPALTGLKGKVLSDTFKFNLNFVRTSISKLRDTCGNPCNYQNSPSNAGYELHVFTDTVDFNAAPYRNIVAAGLCQVKFAIEDQIRNAWTTSFSSSNNNFFLDAGVNICLNFSKVNSPVFSMEPVFAAPINYAYSYSPGPLDSMEYDSLSFEVADPMEAPFDTVNYKKTVDGKFTKTIFLTPYCPPNPGITQCRALPNAKPPRGAYFDPNLCTVTLTPVVANELGAVRFLVREWRRDSSGQMKQIGYVSREMTVETRTMPGNSLPYFSSAISSYQVCPNSQVCITNKSKDDQNLPQQLLADTVKVFWNNGLPTATFSITDTNAREKDLSICWKPDLKTVKGGNYYLTLLTYDKMCNINMVTKTIQVTVKNPTEYNTSKSLSSCGVLKFKVTPVNATMVSGSTTLLDSTGKVLDSRYSANDSFLLNSNGVFFLRYNYYTNANNSCFLTKVDTVKMSNAFPKGFSYLTKDTVVCNTYPYSHQFKPSLVPGLSSWNWQLNGQSVNTTDSVYSGTVSIQTKIKLTLRDNKGCYSISERNYTGYNLGKILFQTDSFGYCNSSVASPKFDTTGLKSPYQTLWKTPSFGVLNYKNELLITNPVKYHQLQVKVIDDNHCVVQDSVILFPLFEKAFALDINKPAVCMDTLVTVSTRSVAKQHLSSVKWNIAGKDSATTLVLQISRKFNVNTRIVLTANTRFNCSVADTIDLTPIKNPSVELPSDTVLCTYTNYDIQSRLKDLSGAWSIQWYLNSVLSSQSSAKYKANLQSKSMLKAVVKNEGYCADEDSMELRVFPGVRLEIKGDTLYNRYAKIEMKTDTTYEKYLWSMGDTTRGVEFWAYQLGAPGKHFVWCEVENDIGCIGRDTLYFRTDAFQSVQNPGLSKIRLYPNPATDVLNVYTDKPYKASLIDPQGRQLGELVLKEGINDVDVSSFSSGSYVLLIDAYSFRFQVIR